ncbi:hypothetical protein ACFYKX_02095 [Cytobacillus sp. FJAT-54145]|uniref:Uncharacterized protein n=1 Tax=Cytobacillus spartinae TaxID=3299023 RepID=A0ABW6K8Z8_9BACI
MKIFRFQIDPKFKAQYLAEDLKLQLEVNRHNNVSISSNNHTNEIVVGVPDDGGETGEIVGSFMESYQTGVILE